MAASAAVPLMAETGGRGRPNLLLLMTDQHRADCIGAYGNRHISTPNLDSLAREGAIFTNAYSSTPTCTPARCGLLTGQSPWRHGNLGLAPVPEKYPVEMPRLLRNSGYYTLGIGKMHWSPMRSLHGFHQTILDEHCQPADHAAAANGAERIPDARSDYEGWFFARNPNLDPHVTGLGWNDYRAGAFQLPEELHPTTWTAETAVRFLSTYRREEPFFLKVSFIRPHSPYDPPERFLKMYERADLPAAEVGDWAQPFARPSSQTPELWHGDLGAAQVRASRQGYYGSVSHVDEQIGRILATLREKGLLNNTLIVMTADHGDMLGDHHLWRKSYAYQSSSHIPMLIRWPDGLARGKRGVTISKPVELRDVLPTFVEAAGGALPSSVDGQSMLPLLDDPNAEWRPWIDLEHDVCYHPSNHWNALTDGRRKYIFHAASGREQFFNLEEDPKEVHDLGGNSQEVAGWRERMIAHLAERGAPWVVDGNLGLRPERRATSPNYPGRSAARS